MFTSPTIVPSLGLDIVCTWVKIQSNQCPVLRAKDPKVRHAQVCEMVAGLVLQGTQVMNTDPWIHNKRGAACMQATSSDNERCRGES